MIRFRENTFYEEAVETPAGVLWWTARVSSSARELVLYDFTMYPTTGTRLSLGYEILRAVFRYIEEQATEQGFTAVRLEGVRMKPGKHERMLSIMRRLR